MLVKLVVHRFPIFKWEKRKNGLKLNYDYKLNQLNPEKSAIWQKVNLMKFTYRQPSYWDWMETSSLPGRYQRRPTRKYLEKVGFSDLLRVQNLDANHTKQ